MIQCDNGPCFEWTENHQGDGLHTYWGVTFRFGSPYGKHAQAWAENRIGPIRSWLTRLEAVGRVDEWPDLLWESRCSSAWQSRLERGMVAPARCCSAARCAFLESAMTCVVKRLTQPPKCHCEACGGAEMQLEQSTELRDAAQAVFYDTVVQKRADAYQAPQLDDRIRFAQGDKVEIYTPAELGGKSQSKWATGYTVTKAVPPPVHNPKGAYHYEMTRRSRKGTIEHQVRHETHVRMDVSTAAHREAAMPVTVDEKMQRDASHSELVLSQAKRQRTKDD